MDMTKFMDLTAEELIVAGDLYNLAKRAEVDAELIANTYGERLPKGYSAEVYNNGGHFREIMTWDGKWKAYYGEETYEVDCSREGIFEIMKAHYIYDKANPRTRDFVSPPAQYREYYGQYCTYQHFCGFLLRLEREIKAAKEEGEEVFLPYKRVHRPLL